MIKRKQKYFFISDTHGMSSHNLEKCLKEKKGDYTNKRHTLVIAGDITDGGKYDNGLVRWLKGVEHVGNLIVVKGNHDSHEFTGYHNLSKKNQNGIDRLPTQVTTKHFNLAHGIYYPPNTNVSQGVSPALLGCPRETGGEVTNEEYENASKLFPTINAYEKGLDKDTYVGHFSEEPLLKYISMANDKNLPLLKKDKNKMYSFGKIHFLDSEVHGTDYKTIKIKIKKYRS